MLNLLKTTSDPLIDKKTRSRHNASREALADHLNVGSQGRDALCARRIRDRCVLCQLGIKPCLVVMPRMHTAHPAQTAHNLVIYQEDIVILTELFHFCKISRPCWLAPKSLWFRVMLMRLTVVSELVYQGNLQHLRLAQATQQRLFRLHGTQ